MKRILWLALFLFVPLTIRAEGPNLLKNGDLITGSEKRVPGWDFSTTSGISEESKAAVRDGKITWNLVDDESSRALHIGIPELVTAHVWWSQTVSITGGTSYTLTFRAKGTRGGAKGASSDVGVCMLEESGKWIGYLPVPHVEFTDDWQNYTFTFTSPDNAGKANVRLGCESRSGALDIRFSNIKLAEQGK